MKNNQFKKIVRKLVDEECDLYDLFSVCVDTSNNHRLIYIYGVDWKWVGLFSFYITSESVHLRFTNLITLSLEQHRVKDVECDYKHFSTVSDCIIRCFVIMDKTEGYSS